jgi:prephenate dehydrogenase
MDAAEHDALFADISHWPHAVAFALSAAIGEGPRADAAIRFHGAGLRDTSRVGGSPADLWAGILLDNREAVLNSSAAFRVQLDTIEDALRRGDRPALSTALSLGERWRSRF